MFPVWGKGGTFSFLALVPTTLPASFSEAADPCRLWRRLEVGSRRTFDERLEKYGACSVNYCFDDENLGLKILRSRGRFNDSTVHYSVESSSHSLFCLKTPLGRSRETRRPIIADRGGFGELTLRARDSAPYPPTLPGVLQRFVGNEWLRMTPRSLAATVYAYCEHDDFN